ncbi:anti-sigma factor antagonist [Herbidospora sp. NEAU-GS84]|uniref:Anti-sigma factor antagonist n=1 Tax=Herbidospora solisilvae TaxID=2696284 RepID=A0A7C9J0L9_9ACTN|nr:STAS domain-containing protein [Herbidospora solisilvae]NAS20260.1 anti-sigma factor antagonist [Herbidospora solisilvae]
MTVMDATAPTVLHLAGDIDIFTTAALRRRILAAVDAGAGPLVLDMSAVNFCGAGGLGVLLHAQRRATAKGVTMTLTGVSPRLARLLEITGLGDRLPSIV